MKGQSVQTRIENCTERTEKFVARREHKSGKGMGKGAQYARGEGNKGYKTTLGDVMRDQWCILNRR